MAQLPSFSVDDSSSLPVTEEYFYDLCSRFLDSKNLAVLKSLTLEPPKNKEETSSTFLNKWYENERMLRFALAQIRSLKLNKKFELENASFPVEIVQTARTACGMDSPLSAEQFLNQYRLNLIENIRPDDDFSLDAVFCYGLKLKLALRMKKFDTEKGIASYKKIYDKILKEGSKDQK